jgi:hypothetical protein
MKKASGIFIITILTLCLVIVGAASNGAVRGAGNEVVCHYTLIPNVDGTSLTVRAEFNLASIPNFKDPYVDDYGQLAEAQLQIDGRDVNLKIERKGSASIFRNLSRRGKAVLTYRLNCVTVPTPNYRKYLMGGSDYIMARTGLFLRIPGREEEMVEVAWDLPAGWQAGIGRTGMLRWIDTQRTLWVAGQPGHFESRMIGGKTVSVCIINGVKADNDRRISGSIDQILTIASEKYGQLQGQYYGLAVFPYKSIGGGTALGLTLATEEDPIMAVHEVLHWWTNNNMPAWFREGVHTYMAARIMNRNGLLSMQEFNGFLNQRRITHESAVNSEGSMSLHEISQKYDANAGGGDIYGIGALFAYKLDREIENATGGHYSLETVFEWVCRNRDEKTDPILLISELTGYDPKAVFAEYFYQPVLNVQELLQ